MAIFDFQEIMWWFLDHVNFTILPYLSGKSKETLNPSFSLADGTLDIEEIWKMTVIWSKITAQMAFNGDKMNQHYFFGHVICESSCDSSRDNYNYVMI